jgi:uncharacterized protein YuzE
MSIKIGTTTFDTMSFDSEADVLYLHVGDPASATDFDESPEGHALRFDAGGRLVGLTMVGARRLLEEESRVVVTLGEPVTVDRGLLARAVASS